VKPAAILAILACGMTAAMWLRLAPALSDASASAGLAPGIGLVAGSLIGGGLIGRRSHKAALVAGLALLGAALWRLAMAPASDMWMRLASGALGLGVGMAFLAANAAVSAAASGSRATALTLLNLPLPVGVLFNPVLSAETMVRATAVLATLALAVAASTLMPPMPPMPLGASAPRETGAGEKRPAISLLALLLFLFAMCEAGTWSWMVRYMGAARVLDRETAWLILSYGLPLGLIVGRAGCWRILVDVAPLRVARGASFAMAFATALLLLARSPSAAWTATFVVGVAMSPILPIALAVAGDALGMGIVLAAGWIGLVASSPLIAWLADRSSLPAAMLLLPAVSLGMALVTMAMRE
jgi:fucose permease